MKTLLSLVLSLFFSVSLHADVLKSGVIKSGVMSSVAAIASGGGGGNPFTLVAHGVANNSAVATVTLNTTSAKLIVAVLAAFSDGARTFVDSGGNTWQFGIETNGGNGNVQIAYCINPSGTGPGHTFTWTDNFVVLSVTAYSYSGGTPTHETETGNNNSTGAFNSLQPGSITPGGNNRLFVVGMGAFNGTNPKPATVDQSFITDSTFQDTNGSFLLGASFYLLQTTGAAVNPTVTPAATSSQGGVVMDSFF